MGHVPKKCRENFDFMYGPKTSKNGPKQWLNFYSSRYSQMGHEHRKENWIFQSWSSMDSTMMIHKSHILMWSASSSKRPRKAMEEDHHCKKATEEEKMSKAAFALYLTLVWFETRSKAHCFCWCRSVFLWFWVHVKYIRFVKELWKVPVLIDQKRSIAMAKMNCSKEEIDMDWRYTPVPTLSKIFINCNHLVVTSK